MFEGEDVEQGEQKAEWKEGKNKVTMLMPGEGEAEVTRVL